MPLYDKARKKKIYPFVRKNNDRLKLTYSFYRQHPILVVSGTVPPYLLSVSPTSGSTLGGTAVTILGSGFFNVSSLTFGGNSATSISVPNSTTINCLTPAGTAGLTNIVVNAQGGSATLSSAFLYFTPAPTITAVSSDLIDTAGGDTISVLGTNLLGATLQTSPDNLSWTNVTSPSNTSTTSTGVTTPIATGSVYLRAINGSLTSSAIVIEAWNPSTDTTSLGGVWDKGGYSVGSFGVWNRRFGTFNMAGGTSTSPSDAGGYPSFNGTNQVLSASVIDANIQSTTQPYAGTFALVTTPFNAPAQSGNGSTGDIADKSLFGDNGRGAIGLNYTNRANITTSSGFMGVITDGVYKTSTAPATINSTHSVVMRFLDKSTLDLCVDGKRNDGNFGVQTSSLGTFNAGTGQFLNVGSGYTTNYYSGSIKAFVTLKEKCSNKWLSKFGKWSAVRHGVLAPTLGVPFITSISQDFVDTSGGSTIIVTGVGLSNLTSVSINGISISFTAISSTSFSFIMPAKSPGLYGLVAANSTGSSLPFYIEAWDPSAITGIDSYFDSRKGVTTSVSQVTSWTEQTRQSSYTPVLTSPTLVSNVFGSQPSIRFTQTNALTGSRRGLGTGLSAFWVGKWTSNDSAYDAYQGNPPLTVVGDTTGGIVNAIGASSSSLDFTQFGSGGWIHSVRGNGLNDGLARVVGWTLDTAGNLKAYAGSTQQGVSASLSSQVATIPNDGYNAIGGSYNGINAADGYAGDLGAVIVTLGVISPADLIKLENWSQIVFGTVPAQPTLTSINYSIADSAGGDLITLTGTNLLNGTCLVGSTLATVVSTTTSSLVFVMPAISAGTYNVQVTTSGGTSNTISLESWSPLSEPSITSLLERPNYSSSTGIWTLRYGPGSYSSTSPKLSANNGAPVLNGSQYISGSSLSSVLLSATGGGVACVVSPTNESNPEASPVYSNNALWSKAGSGPIELWNATDNTNHWFGFSVYDSIGSYIATRKNVTNLLNNQHAVVCTYKQANYIRISVDGSDPSTSSTAMTGNPLTFDGVFNIGADYANVVRSTGEIRVFCTFNAELSATFATKFYQWARSRHGVT